MNPYKFRDFIEKDLDSLCEVENECFVLPWSKELLYKEFTENPFSHIIVALNEDDKVIGFINFYITFNSATIAQIAVKETHRRKGIASKLLEYMETSFPSNEEDKVEVIILEVRKSNIRAIKFYENRGFIFNREIKGYYTNGENALVYLRYLL